MKIEVQGPFVGIWNKAYVYVSSTDGRSRVCLVNSKTDRTLMSYARYLMCVKLNRILGPDEEVDHKDTDRTNDDLDNLQVLPKSVHKEKSDTELRTGRTYTTLICSFCDKEFQMEGRKCAPTTMHFFCCRDHLWEYQRIAKASF